MPVDSTENYILFCDRGFCFIPRSYLILFPCQCLLSQVTVDKFWLLGISLDLLHQENSLTYLYFSLLKRFHCMFGLGLAEFVGLIVVIVISVILGSEVRW